MHNHIFYVGTWKLRISNDRRLNSITYLVLNIDNTFKIKTINSNGFIAIKTYKYGKLKLNKFKQLIKKSKSKNKINVNAIFDSQHKYSYSVFGIEVPEIKFEDYEYVNLNKNLDIICINNALLIKDKYKYYLFDLIDNPDKLPYIETSLNTMLFTQFFGFILNLILIKIIH
jgi:hypothetical protein